jgi:hypothetical protein
VRKTALLLGLAVTLMAVKSATASKKSIATEQRYNAAYVSIWTSLNSHTATLATVEADLATLAPLIAYGDPAFLANLRMLPNQTTSNDNSFSDTAFTGLANAVNNLQANLQGYGYENV